MATNCDMLYKDSQVCLQKSIEMHKHALLLQEAPDIWFNLAQVHLNLAEIWVDLDREDLAYPEIQQALQSISHSIDLQERERIEWENTIQTSSQQKYEEIPDIQARRLYFIEADKEASTLVTEIASLACSCKLLEESDFEKLCQIMLPITEKLDILKLMDWYLAKTKRLVLGGKENEVAWIDLLQVFDHQLSQLPQLNLQNPLDPNSSVKPLHIQLLCDKADAYIDFAETLLDSCVSTEESASIEIMTRAWNMLGVAAKSLKMANTYNPNHVRILISRADLEIQRAAIPIMVAQNSKLVLYKNAKVLYEKAFRDYSTKKTTRTFAEIVLKHYQLQKLTNPETIKMLDSLTEVAQEDILNTI